MKKIKSKFHNYLVPKTRINGISQYFNQLTDPRDNRGKKYELSYLMKLFFTGILMGAQNITGIENILKLNSSKINQFINLEPGIPSHDCFNDLLNVLNPEELEEILTTFTTDHLSLKPGSQINYDGTAVRAGTDRIHNGKTPYILNSLEVNSGLVLSALKIDQKENEKVAILRDLEHRDIEETVITADALNNTRQVMDLIKSKNGHFVFPVKKEHHELMKLILETLVSKVADFQTASKNHQRYGVALKEKDYDVFSTVEKNRSRLEVRRLYITSDISGIDQKLYPQIRQIGILESTRIEFVYDENGQVSNTKTSFNWCALMTDLKDYSAEQLLKIKRDQWSIESFHHIKDNYLLEDRCTVKTENGLINYAVIRRIVYNCLIFLESIAPETKNLSTSEKLKWLQSHLEIVMMLILGYISDCFERLKKFFEDQIIELNIIMRENKNKVPPPKLLLKSERNLLSEQK